MKKSVKVALACVGIAVVGVGVAPVLGRATNCGGNSAALARVGIYAKTVYIWAEGSRDHRFKMEQFSSDPDAAREAHYSGWIEAHAFLVSTAPFSIDETGTKKIVIVCDQAFNNVPRHWLWFWHAPYTHAVGYSNGTVGLISTDEFAALDKNGFVHLDEIAPASPQP